MEETMTGKGWTHPRKVLEQLQEYASSHQLTPKEKEAYENSLWKARDYMAAFAYAERKAYEEGYALGLAESREKGRAEEHEKLLNTARALLVHGMSRNQVMEITGMTDEEMSQV